MDVLGSCQTLITVFQSARYNIPADLIFVDTAVKTPILAIMTTFTSHLLPDTFQYLLENVPVPILFTYTL
jgi:hypothetical protein